LKYIFYKLYLVYEKGFWRIPKIMRKTLMLDNGKEFSQFKQVEEKTGFWIYFSSSNSCKVLKIKTTNK
jgi:hypothetical protein